MPYYISPPPQSPLARIVATLVTVFALIGAFMISMAALLVVGGIALVAGLAIWLRVAWIKRRLKKSGLFDDLAGAQADRREQEGRVIEAEYTVVSEDEEQREE